MEVPPNGRLEKIRRAARRTRLKRIVRIAWRVLWIDAAVTLLFLSLLALAHSLGIVLRAWLGL